MAALTAVVARVPSLVEAQLIVGMLQSNDIDAAVSAGRLTQAQEQQVLSDLKQRVTDLVNGIRPSGGDLFRGASPFGFRTHHNF